MKLLSETVQAHERGGVLVAAVFDAFVTIFERRTADLFQLGGVQPGSKPLPDRLVARLGEEAARAASSVLQMCVRGLDYLPPVAPTFGEYLRAIITADTDLVPDDPLRYRVAFAEAFRKRGIPVPGCISYAPDALCWEPPDIPQAAAKAGFTEAELHALLESVAGKNFDPERPAGLFSDALSRLQLDLRFGGPKREGASMSSEQDVEAGNNLREKSMRIVRSNQKILHDWFARPSEHALDSREDRLWELALGIRMLPLLKMGETPLSIKSTQRKPCEMPRSWPDRHIFNPENIHAFPSFEVHSVRVARRNGPGGHDVAQLVAQVTQRRHGYFDEEEQKQADRGELPDQQGDFWFRGGATIIVDLHNGQLQHVIRKRIDDDERLDRQRGFLLGDELALAMVTDDQNDAAGVMREPFAFLHGDEG